MSGGPRATRRVGWSGPIGHFLELCFRADPESALSPSIERKIGRHRANFAIYGPHFAIASNRTRLPRKRRPHAATQGAVLASVIE
jgi:hypothetical protein